MELVNTYTIPTTQNLGVIKIEERSWQIILSSRPEEIAAALSGIERTDSLLTV